MAKNTEQHVDYAASPKQASIKRTKQGMCEESGGEDKRNSYSQPVKIEIEKGAPESSGVFGLLRAQ
ncbi:MAG TPA: hypothetical protein VNN78_01430 [Burkholderiales bacterium]|nr:hypothetical protein [Burkholderiales bacterium]